ARRAGPVADADGHDSSLAGDLSIGLRAAGVLAVQPVPVVDATLRLAGAVGRVEPDDGQDHRSGGEHAARRGGAAAGAEHPPRLLAFAAARHRAVPPLVRPAAAGLAGADGADGIPAVR